MTVLFLPIQLPNGDCIGISAFYIGSSAIHFHLIRFNGYHTNVEKDLVF